MDSDISALHRIASPAPPPRKSRKTLVIALLLLAFVGGICATIWAAPRLGGWLGSSTDTETPVPMADIAGNAMPAASQTAPQTLPALEARLAAVSAKLDTISRQAEDAGGNADRAEALLIAFAARRALDRGVPLGYLEGELRLRFADAQPRAVATIINAAASPVTLADLQARLSDLAPMLIGTSEKADWWSAAKRELSSLIIVRKAGAPSPEPQRVMERAQMMLSSGRVDAALGEIERMRNHEKADSWLQMARQYNEARRALDVIEAAAILEPKRIAPPQAPDDAAPAL